MHIMTVSVATGLGSSNYGSCVSSLLDVRSLFRSDVWFECDGTTGSCQCSWHEKYIECVAEFSGGDRHRSPID